MAHENFAWKVERGDNDTITITQNHTENISIHISQAQSILIAIESCAREISKERDDAISDWS